MGIGDREENSWSEKVSLFNIKRKRQVSIIFRREIIRYGSSLMLDCIQMLFSQTYVSVTFLMLYTAMWLLNIQFDTHFFAIAYGLLIYMRTTIIEFFSYAVKDFVNYLSAQRRIQVCSHDFMCTSYLAIFIIGISFAWGIWERQTTIVSLTNRAFVY